MKVTYAHTTGGESQNEGVPIEAVMVVPITIFLRSCEISLSGIVRVKFEDDVIPNSYLILAAQTLQLLGNQRTALPIQP